MQVSLMILPDYNCTQSIYTDVDAETQVCAGIGNGKDTCQGDSGNITVCDRNQTINKFLFLIDRSCSIINECNKL